jgi:glyoxylase-like metal-dependent hydrolase (beta-lactamase superfamily II)
VSRPALPRRAFLLAAGSALGLAALPAAVRGHATTVPPVDAARRGRRRSRRAEPWGRLEGVAPDTWALISSPRNDHPEARRTLCNGGVIAGRDGVLMVEGFAGPAGAAWMAEQAERLTGRRPTHVVVTHFHGDHTGGTAGYARGAELPAVLATATTRRLLAEQEAGHDPARREARPLLLPDTVLPDHVDETLDLGGSTVRLVGRRGHTPSDLVIEAGGVIFAGDLVWNGLFPNCTHAIPTDLGRHVRGLRDLRADVYVSGHGELSRAADMARYIDLLDHIEAAARRAMEAGTPVEQAAAGYTVPRSLGEWYMFSPRYPELAFRAWARALGG